MRKSPPRLLPHLPFVVSNVHPIHDGSPLIGTASVCIETANGERVTIHGWRVIETETGSRHISVPVERIPAESPIGRRYSPIVTYPRGWNPTLRAAILGALSSRSEGSKR